MTDMEHKPNGWNLPINQMTEEEWKDYFECRKKYDIKLSVDEEKTQYEKIMSFLHVNGKNFIEESKKMPVLPNMAISYKCFHGLKAMKDFNLYWAKEVYPDEF